MCLAALSVTLRRFAARGSVAAFLLLGCPQEKEARASAPVSAADAQPLDALTRRLGEARGRLRARGYDDLRLLRRVFVSEGETAFSLPLQFPSGQCLTFAGLGSGDLPSIELAISDESGLVVSRSVGEQEEGVVHACPVTGQHYVLSVRALSGEGVVALTGFGSAPGVGRGFEGLFLGIVAPLPEVGAPALVLRSIRPWMRERNLVSVAEPVAYPLFEGAFAEGAVRLEANQCYAFVLRNGEGISDTDFALLGPDGADVARDAPLEVQPSVEHCSQVTGEHTYRVSAFGGAGSVTVLVLRRASGAQKEPLPMEAVDPLPAPDPSTVARVDPLPPRSLDSLLALQRNVAAYLRAGFTQVASLAADEDVGVGETLRFSHTLMSGCAVFLGESSGLVDLDLYLQTAGGLIADRDTRVGQSVSSAVCVDEPETFNALVRSYGGAGPAGRLSMVVLRPPEAIQDLIALRLLSLEALWGRRDQGGELGTPHIEIRTSVGEREARQVAIPPAAVGCALFVAAGSQTVDDLDLELIDAEGRVLAGDTGPSPMAALQLCRSTWSGLRVRMTSYQGSGDCELRGYFRLNNVIRAL